MYPKGLQPSGLWGVASGSHSSVSAFTSSGIFGGMYLEESLFSRSAVGTSSELTLFNFMTSKFPGKTVFLASFEGGFPSTSVDIVLSSSPWFSSGQRVSPDPFFLDMTDYRNCFLGSRYQSEIWLLFLLTRNEHSIHCDEWSRGAVVHIHSLQPWWGGPDVEWSTTTQGGEMINFTVMVVCRWQA